MQGYEGVLITAQGDGTAGTSTTENSLLPSAAKLNLQGNAISWVGQMLRLRATGRISNIVTTPGTLTFKLKLGPTNNIAVATSSAFQLNAVAKTNVSWTLDLDILVKSVGTGTSATLLTNGLWTSESVVGSAVPGSGGSGALLWQASAPAVGTGFDSTITNVFDLTGTFSLTGNSVQLHTMCLESIN
jgi:hypothetical protein